MTAKREAGGERATVPEGLPSHSEALDSGRESYPPGQRGDGG
jgi:hypothetical protein